MAKAKSKDYKLKVQIGKRPIAAGLKKRVYRFETDDPAKDLNTIKIPKMMDECFFTLEYEGKKAMHYPMRIELTPENEAKALQMNHVRILADAARIALPPAEEENPAANGIAAVVVDDEPESKTEQPPAENGDADKATEPTDGSLFAESYSKRLVKMREDYGMRKEDSDEAIRKFTAKFNDGWRQWDDEQWEEMLVATEKSWSPI